MRIIHGNEFDARIHQRCNERQIAREAIQLGDDELGFAFPAKGQRPLKVPRNLDKSVRGSKKNSEENSEK